MPLKPLQHSIKNNSLLALRLKTIGANLRQNDFNQYIIVTRLPFKNSLPEALQRPCSSQITSPVWVHDTCVAGISTRVSAGTVFATLIIV